jgi:hypothetical protein
MRRLELGKKRRADGKTRADGATVVVAGAISPTSAPHPRHTWSRP